MPVTFAIVWFSLTDLADILSTNLFLGSPWCTETNPLFAPFSGNPLLLSQMYLMAWFLQVGIAGFWHLLIKKVNTHWAWGMFWYAPMCWFGLLHLMAAGHNLALLPLCRP
jgi:hypothetical protein